MTAVRLFGGTAKERMNILTDNVVSKAAMDTPYGWLWDERDFPRRAVITQWFFDPLKGQPRYVDIHHLRQLAASEWVFMCTSTIIEEVCQVPWEVVPKDPQLQEAPPEDLQDEIDELNHFLNNPNDNKGETINTLFRAFLADSLEVDAAVLVKGFSEGSYSQHPAGGLELRPPGQRQLVELFCRDGASFLKETDIHGIEYKYYQYSYLHPAKSPIEFDVNEIAYAMRYPKAYNVYGWSEIQSMETILNSLINSAFTNATMFEEYAVPSGIISFTGSVEDEQRLREYFRSEIKGRFHKVAVLNKEAKFQPITLTNRDLEFINGQKWFSRLVWALYKLTPSELGFQDEIRETGKAMAAQASLQKRKAVLPLLRLLEQIMNNQIINEFSDRLIFRFQPSDKEEEYTQDQLDLQKIAAGTMTINEWRKKRKIGAPVVWGDVPMSLQLAQARAAAQLGAPQAPSPPQPGAALKPLETQGVFEALPVSPVRAFNPSTGRYENVPMPYPMGAMGKQPDLREKMTPPIPSVAGGKRREVSFLKALIPDHELYVEPFAGGAAVFFAFDEPPRKAVLNDINPRFTKVWEWIQKATPEDVEELKSRKWSATREDFFRVKDEYEPKTETDEIWKILYVTRHSFMNRGETWRGNIAEPGRQISQNSPPAWLDRIEKYKEQLKGTRVEQRDWKEVVRDYDSPSTFFYVDPPYEERFAKELIQVLPEIEGRWLLSFGYDEELAEALKSQGFHTYAGDVTNLVNKPGAATRTVRRELIAANYPIEIPEGLVFKALGPEHTHEPDEFRGSVKAEKGLARRLSSLLKAFRSRELSRDEALTKAAEAIEKHEQQMVEIAKRKATRDLGLEVKDLSPEVALTIQSFRSQTLGRFEKILDDAAAEKP